MVPGSGSVLQAAGTGNHILQIRLHKKLLHRHLSYAVHVQIRQYARDIVEENTVASHDIKIIRPEPFLVIVKDIRNKGEGRVPGEGRKIYGGGA